LKFASDKFEEHREKLIAEGKDKYLEMEAFYSKVHNEIAETCTDHYFRIEYKDFSEWFLPNEII
jgi:hypothetical protein